MNYLFPFLVAIAIYLFKRQERRHAFECSLFYSYELIRHRINLPKRDMTESLLILFVGATLLEIGLVFLRTLINVLKDENARKIIQNEITGQSIFIAMLIGAGIGMLTLGLRSMVLNYRYRKYQRSELGSGKTTNPNQM